MSSAIESEPTTASVEHSTAEIGADGARPIPQTMDDRADCVTIIEARSGLQLLDGSELLAYRDLFRFLVWRQVRVRYAQSAIGIGWAVIQPVFSVLLFTVVFGNLARVSSDGVPYALFSFAALVPWTYFSNALTDGVNSLVGEANMLRKIYFPRLLMPASSVTAKMIDFTIAMLCFAVVMALYQHVPPWEVVFFPALVALMVAAALAASIWLTALAVQYRDVKHAMAFAIQLLMYASPVVYPASLIPEQYRLAYAINPMVGVIEGFRACLLGTQPMPWDLIGVSTVVTSLLLVTGLVFFRKREKVFADIA